MFGELNQPMKRFVLSSLALSKLVIFKPVLAAGVMVVCALFMVGLGRAAEGQRSAVYTISNFQVWAEAKDAVTAKRAALEDGKVVAFSQLIRRLSLLGAGNKMAAIPGDQVSKMITSLAVKDERNSNTEYIASMDFQFSPELVRKFMRGQNIPYYDRQGASLILVPIVDQSLLLPLPGSQKPQLSQKDWETSWQTLDLAHALVPIVLKERLALVDDSVIAALVRGDQNSRDGLLKAYNSPRVVLALITSAPSKNKVRLMIIGRDEIGDVTYKRDHIVSKGDLLQAVDLAAEVALGMIEARVKLLKIRPVALRQDPVEVLPWQTDLQEAPPVTGWQGEARGELVVLHVPFQGLGHWQSIRRRLLEVDGIDGLNIEKLSARGADVTCDFPGGAAALVEALRPHGFFMTPRDGGWLLQEG